MLSFCDYMGQAQDFYFKSLITMQEGTLLVVCTRLYKPLCWSISRSVCWSVGPSVCPSVAVSSEHATYGDQPCFLSATEFTIPWRTIIRHGGCRLSVCLSVCVLFRVSFCVFHSGNFISKAILNFFHLTEQTLRSVFVKIEF